MRKLKHRLPIPLVLVFVACSSLTTSAQNPGRPPTIAAMPNPVTSEAGKLGTTRVSWNTGNSSWGQVFVSENGKPEALFNQGAEGAAEAPWIGEGVYKFRLYAGTDHKRLLAAVEVTHGVNSVGSVLNRKVISAIWLAPLLSIVLLCAGFYLAFKRDHTEMPRAVISKAQPVRSLIQLRMSAASLIVSMAVLGFIGVASWKIAEPGLYYDELITVVPSLAFAKSPFSGAVNWEPESQVRVFGHSLPLMIMSYIGAVKTIIYVPVAALFGFTPESFRYFAIIIAALSLVTTFAFVKRLFDPAVGAATIVLLASDPSFIFYSRTDLGPFVFMMLLKAIALWQLTIWWKTGRNTALFAGFFALGIGVYDKANFIWIIGALITAAVLLSPHRLRGLLSAKSTRFACLGFLAGAMPLVWFNLSWPPRTLAALFGPATAGGPSGGPAVQFVQRAGVLTDLLDGRNVEQMLGRDARFPPILPFLVGIAAMFIIVQCLRRSTRSATGSAAYVLLCGLLILGAAAVTRGGYQGWHVILVYPFPHLVLAYVLIQCARKIRRSWPQNQPILHGALLSLLILIPAATNGSSVVAIYETLQTTGGYGNWSDAIYQLNDKLLTQPDEPVIVLDWGIHYNLVALSQGRLQSTEIWSALNDPGASTDALQDSFKHRNYRYVLHEPAATNFPLPRQRFFEAVANAGLAAKLQHTFSSRDGRPTLEIYTVEAGDPPLTANESKEPLNPLNTPNAKDIRASITAAPSPVTSRAGQFGTTSIMWTTGDGSWGQVYVSHNGKPETLFAQGAQGSAIANWIGEGVYEFLLYAGTDHRQLLAVVQVKGTFTPI